MNIVFVLVPLAMLLLAVAIGAFVWAVRNGQFDDLESPATRILYDEDGPGKIPVLPTNGQGRRLTGPSAQAENPPISADYR